MRGLHGVSRGMTAEARHLERTLERIANALEKLAAGADSANDTVDVKGAAEILRCTPRAVYTRHCRGQLPPPVRGARRLVWRKADLLRSGK